MKYQWLRVLAVLIPAVALPAARQTSPTAGGAAANSSAWAPLQQSAEKMHAAMMATRPSKNNDEDFARLMLLHHQAAIEMARAELLYGTDPQVRRLAQEIVADQQSEIELMQLWLKQHESLK